ncbi:MAG TPA: hypothetical protein ENF53_03705 [Thermoprotei archaeon]|nr:hypothetical protein [Thermoprotei archaeon]
MNRTVWSFTTSRLLSRGISENYLIIGTVRQRIIHNNSLVFDIPENTPNMLNKRTDTLTLIIRRSCNEDPEYYN